MRTSAQRCFLAKNIARVQGRQLLFESVLPVGSCMPRGRAERGSRNSLGAHGTRTIQRCLLRPRITASAPVMTSSVRFLLPAEGPTSFGG